MEELQWSACSLYFTFIKQLCDDWDRSAPIVALITWPVLSAYGFATVCPTRMEHNTQDAI